MKIIDITREIDLENGEANPFGWSVSDIFYRGSRIGCLYCGEPRYLDDGYFYEKQKSPDGGEVILFYAIDDLEERNKAEIDRKRVIVNKILNHVNTAMRLCFIQNRLIYKFMEQIKNESAYKKVSETREDILMAYRELEELMEFLKSKNGLVIKNADDAK